MTVAHDNILFATPLAVGARAAMSEALRLADLPTDDLDDAGVQAFAFRDGEATIGYAGLELYQATRCCAPSSSIRRADAAGGAGRSSRRRSPKRASSARRALSC